MPPTAESRSAPAALPADDIRRGIFYVSLAVFSFSLFNVVIKWLSDEYPIGELVFFRSFFALFPCLLLVHRAGGLAVLRTSRPGAHLTRAAIWLISFCCSFTALHLLPLADATAFSFAAPLFMTALSVPILRERVGPHRWGAVVFGFLGVLVMARPSGEVLRWGALFGLGNALFYALGSLSVREMRRTERSEAIVFYTQLFASCIAGLSLFFSWRTPSWRDIFPLIATGLAGGVAQYWATQAYRYAPAAVVAPFTYAGIVWAVLFGYLVWGDLPEAAVLGGAAIVIASGLYILHRETRS
jgi:drug/metabolite transporter (DMT)-like permease